MTTRPTVSVIVPFKGSAADAERLMAGLASLRLRPGDEIIVVDNSQERLAALRRLPERLRVVPAPLESSSYYARNVGAEEARGDWLLFFDADCRPHPDLVDRYFAVAPRESDGALAGSVRGVGEQQGFFVRFSRRYPVVEQQRLVTYLGRPYASTANLLVRAAAWRDAGGFAERVRSGGDIDFSWRLLELGWTLGERQDAVVEHRHRERFAEFIRPPVRYGAGLAWVLRRWPERSAPHNDRRHLLVGMVGTLRWLLRGKPDQAGLRALFAVFNLAHIVGRALPNRPPRREPPSASRIGLCATSLPADDRVLERARAREAHIEATARPLRMRASEVRDLDLNYLEDDAPVTRLAAAARLAVRQPLHAARWRMRRPAVSLLVAAPAAVRFRRAGVERVEALDRDARPLAAAAASLADIPYHPR